MGAIIVKVKYLVKNSGIGNVRVLKLFLRLGRSLKVLHQQNKHLV